MASIASSGPISFADIQAVMGGTGPVSIQDYAQSAAARYAKGVPGIGDSNLSITDFQGKSKALLDGLQYRIFRRRYTFSAATSSGTAGGGSYGGGGGGGGVIVNDYTTALGPASSATAAAGTTSGGAGTGFGAGGGGTGTIKARYITFQYGNGNNGNARYMNLGGIRVYSTYGGSNIINSSMATSAYDQHPAYPPSYMVDNDDNTFYHANYTEYPWVKVDLGSEQFIHTIQLTNRVDCCRFRIAGVTMQLQDNNGTVIYTSQMCTLPNGTTIYENSGSHMDGYLYYYFYPGTNTNVYGTDSTPSSPFAAGQGASGFAYILPPTLPNGTITARYLMFEYGNGNSGTGRYLQSAGVRVYGSPSGSNIITSSMTVTDLSTLDGYIPAYMVDNNETTMYISNAIEYPWVKIDLGSEQAIHRVELSNRPDCCQNRLAGIRLVLSNASNTIVHTSGLIASKSGTTTYQEGTNAFLYYTFWPSITTTPIGSDSIPYPSTEFFTNASTSYTFPNAGTAKILLMGGGGGGGRNAGANSRGGGGGGAGYLQTYFVPVSSGNVATLTVGGPGTQDVSGGTTSAVINGTTYSASGGGNGNASQTGGIGSSTGGSGGSATQASGGGRSFIRARYIQFEYGNGNGGAVRYMHYMTVRVYSTANGSNITTPSMTVTASSSASGSSPSYVIDNNDGTFWHSAEEEYPWLKIDLGSEQYIHKVEMMNRSDCCRGRAAGARLVLKNGSDNAIYTSNLMTRSDGVTTTYQEYPGNDGYLYYNWWPAANTNVYGSNSTPYADIAMNQSGAPCIGHLNNDGGYFADDPTWFDSRTENYPTGLVTNFTNINTATGGIVPSDSSWLTYSVEWFGYFYATVTGTYTFYTNTDDASYVWVGSTALSGYTTSNCLVNNGSTHTVQERSATISLTAGTYYPIRFQFGQNISADSCSLSFSAPGISRTYNLSGYVFYGMGTYSSFPINSARLLRATNIASEDRTYFVNVAGTATPTYCLMNSKWDGGGWMMMMKATRGTTFQYSSTYWTDATTTLNTGSTDRTDADAKFAIMNQVPIKDIMASWPDVGTTGGSISQSESWTWLVNNYYYGGARATPLLGFSSTTSRDATTHFLNTSDQTSFAGYSSSIWSQQSGAKRHVFGGGIHLSANASARWGFLWNNEGDFASIDVTGGIGMSHGSYSAGDYYGTAGTQVLNRTMRVEMYGR